MTKAPTVSVVMATYNGEEYIREQIDSILSQSYPIYELIIQDDGSTDSTPQICREYEAKRDNVHFYQNEHNLGFNENFRTATMRATGDFIALSDQDDIWFPQKIEEQIAAIGTHDICSCAISKGSGIDSAKDDLYSGDPRPEVHVFRDVLGHTMLMRSDFAKDKGNWQGAFAYDWSLTLHADWGRGITKVHETLVFHRTYDKSFTGKMLLKARSSAKYAPYIEGRKCFRKMQEMPKFIEICTSIINNTKERNEESLKLQNKLATLMLSTSSIDYWRLCLLCLRKRKVLYNPPYKAKGIPGIARGLFFPAIHAYYTSNVYE